MDRKSRHSFSELKVGVFCHYYRFHPGPGDFYHRDPGWPVGGDVCRQELSEQHFGTESLATSFSSLVLKRETSVFCASPSLERFPLLNPTSRIWTSSIS